MKNVCLTANGLVHAGKPATVDNIKPFDTGRIKGKIYTLTNGGQITLFKDKDKNTYFITADKVGEDVMVKKNMGEIN